MKFIRFTFLFMILMGLSLTAWNIDSRRMTALGKGPRRVKAVFIDSQGIKWFGTDQGLYRYDNLTWAYYTESDYLVNDEVNAITYEESDSGSEIWIATTAGVTVLAYDLDGITGSTSYTVEDGLLDDNVSDIGVDSHHSKFFGSEAGITWFHSGRMDTISYDTNYRSMVNAPVKKLLVHADTLYIASDGGIGRFVTGVDAISGATRWTSEYGVTPLSGNINNIFVDSRGHQWFGTDMGVEEHIGLDAQENWILYTKSDGLVDGMVLSIAEDERGGMWFGTMGGVSYLFDDTWTSYTAEDGLASDTVYDIAVDTDGSLWFGTHRGVAHLVNGVFNHLFTHNEVRKTQRTEMTAFYDRMGQSIRIRVHVELPGKVKVELYTIDGRLCMVKEAGFYQEGLNELNIYPGQNGFAPEPGLYILRVYHNGIYETQKMFISR